MAELNSTGASTTGDTDEALRRAQDDVIDTARVQGFVYFGLMSP